jgi:ADP-ribosylglycohydrolase
VTRILEVVGWLMAAVAWVGLVVLVLLAVGWLSGCGGAISAQARAASVATVALEGAHRLAMDETRERLAACQDEPCVDGVERDLAPVALAHDAARATLAAWVEALRVAVVAGEDGDVVAALVTAASRLLSEWSALVAALARVGVEVPPLPGFVLQAGVR